MLADSARKPVADRPAGAGRAVRLSRVGLITLLVMFLGCVLTMPYTLGQAPVAGSDVGANGPHQARYDRQILDLYLLPPSWAPRTDAERERVSAYLEKMEAEKADAAPASIPFFLLGTDKLGRDFFVRCLAGGGISLTIGIAAAAISVFIGTLWGMIAGYVGGRTDAVMMRLVDILYGLPYILLVVLLAVGVDGLIDRIELQAAATELAGGTGADSAPPWWLTWIRNHRTLINVATLLIAIGGVSWLTMARVIRGQVLSLKTQPFMEAARAIGVPVYAQFTRHLLPNLLGPVIVYATLTVPQAILQESFLSFLGIGIQQPLPSWGNLAAEGLSQLNPVASRWWLLLWPCLLLGVTLLALNFVGEGLREAFDPKRRQVVRVTDA